MLEKSFDPKTAETRLYKQWEDGGHFKPRAAKPGDTADDNYCIMIPPPNVTGSLHMGHALNNTIMDILIRFNRMKGKAVLWQPGMDHAGIATQMVVERKLADEGQYRKDMTRKQFLDHVWAWKEESGGNIFTQLRRLGSSYDWSREKFTLGDPDDDSDLMAEAVTKAFVDMYNDGLIYRDKRLVNWDPKFQTAISDLEVETKTVDGHYWHLRYPISGGVTYEHPITDEDGNVTGHETRDYLIVATSRPETMLGDTGVAVNPEDERYASLVGKFVDLPIVGRRVPIIADDYADPEKGSGAVKITPAHDFNDYEVGKRAGHEPISILDERGHILPLDIIPEDYHGLFTVKARKAVVAAFDALGLLDRTEDLKIEQPFGDRSGVVIEPMLTDQWFVDTQGMAEQAMAAVARGHEAAVSDPVGQSQRSAEPARVREAGNTNLPSAHPAPHSAHPRAGGDPDSAAGSDWVPAFAWMSGESNGTGQTRFIPENWKKTFDHWMKDIQPWCISRQLWWGHQIPAWILGAGGGVAAKWVGAEETNQEKCEHAEYDEIWDQLTRLPVVTALEQEVPDLLKKNFERISEVVSVSKIDTDVGGFTANVTTKLNQTLSFTFHRDPDVLDTWFSSGLWPFSTLGWPENTEELKRFYPTSVLVTAFDIIFFWVARMMMQGIHFMGEVPFKDVYIHALVLDETGKKMSKSIGNTLDPLDLIDGVSADELIEKRTRGLKNPDKAPQIAKATRKQYPDGFEPYGADALRFTLASMAGQGRSIRLSVDRIAGYRNFGTKLWSAAAFGQMNGCKPVSFDPASATLPVNKWIISETVKTVADISKQIDGYRFNDASDAAYKFTWDTFCAWYLEMIKPLLSGEDGPDKEETRATFAWALDNILKMLHPFMPFITEDIWAKTSDARETMLIVAPWPQLPDSLIDADASAEIEWLQTLISNLRSVRADMNIPPSKKAPLLMISDKLDPRLAAYADVLSPMGRVDGVDTAGAAPKGALQTVVGGVTYAIPVDDLIDFDAERARLTKEIEKLQEEMDKVDKKLGNANFVDRAPAAVVEEQKSRRESFAAQQETVRQALANLPA